MSPIPPKPSISFVIVSYNTGAAIAEVMRHLHEEIGTDRAQVIVVDNASADDTVAIARSAAAVSDDIIASSENLGYARAANLGLGAARGRYSFVMNDDAIIDGASVARLTSLLESDHSIALVGPRIVTPDGFSSPAAREIFPGVREEWERIRRLLGSSHDPDVYGYEAATDVAWLVGACVAGRTTTLRSIGGFNEEFFLYGEDIELGRRIRSMGMRSVTVPDARCVHIGGVATALAYDDSSRSNRQKLGRDTYYRLWLSRPARILVNLLRSIGATGQPRRMGFYLRRALWDGPSIRHKRFPKPLHGSSTVE